MKKTAITILLASAMCVTTAKAFLYIAWNTPSGFTLVDGVTPLMPDPQTALIQLIYTPDAVPGDPIPGAGIPAGDDIILAEQTISEALIGDPWGFFFSEIYGPAPDLVGYVYIRVFQGGTSIGNVPVGSYYHTGPLFATVNNPGPPTVPDDVNAGNAAAGDGDLGTFRLTQVVVPEPSVLALAALGAAVVAVRRFRRS